MTYCQGDIIKVSGFKNKFLILSKNAFIKATKAFHVCPLMEDYPEGPIHIKVEGKKAVGGTAICEQIKLIDPVSRGCSTIDHIPYEQIMNVSDALQGMLEYD